MLGLPVTAIGVLLAVQTTRLRFKFDAERLMVGVKSNSEEAERGLKVIRSWRLENITNWEVWWKPFPVLAYFKESESYDGRGSVHFFPVLYDGGELISALRTRCPHLDKKEYE